MNQPIPPAPVKYLADIQNVKEVTLVGTADLAFWQNHVRRTDLRPLDRHGKAELLISATGIRWMGTRFNELSISLAVCGTGPAAAGDGFYLVQAWNSLRLYAFMERRFFHTPYDNRSIRLLYQAPALVRLNDGDHVACEATMDSSRSPSASAYESWEGPIYLPSAAPGNGAPPRYFVALLAGYTDVYPFLPSDRLDIRPRPQDRALQALVDSNFVPQEWRIRSNAHHAKSRTY